MKTRRRRHTFLMVVLAAVIGLSIVQYRGAIRVQNLPPALPQNMTDEALLDLQRNVVLQAMGTVIYLHVKHKGQYPSREHLDQVLSPMMSRDFDLPREQKFVPKRPPTAPPQPPAKPPAIPTPRQPEKMAMRP